MSDSAPGLVDMTAGGTLSSGGSLVQNHLYLGTIDGRGVKATSAVTFLGRGSYTISSHSDIKAPPGRGCAVSQHSPVRGAFFHRDEGNWIR